MIPKPKKPRKKKPESIMKYAKDYCQYCKVHRIILVEQQYVIDPPHHIDKKGMGGSSNPAIYSPENLITLCRYHHDMAHHKIPGMYLTPEQLREAKRIEEGNNAN